MEKLGSLERMNKQIQEMSRQITIAPSEMATQRESSRPLSERVPSALPHLTGILRAAEDLKPINPIITYLCHVYVLKLISSPRNVRGLQQFKTSLLKLTKEEGEEVHSPSLRYFDVARTFFTDYYEQNTKEDFTRTLEETTKNCQVASVLYDMLKAHFPRKIDKKIEKYAEELEHKKRRFVFYNILPVHATGVVSEIMTLHEIKAAVSAVRAIHKLPDPTTMSKGDDHLRAEYEDESQRDLLGWLGIVFGFQHGNVENQREHLILLLANIYKRGTDAEKTTPNEETLWMDKAVRHLMDKLFKNYFLWCDYLHIKANFKKEPMSERDILYIGLYLLIWGEASNVRFMPECLCYIFHKMANELNQILDNNDSSVRAAAVQPVSSNSFLDSVIKPIYQVIQKEAQRNKGGTASHSKWRNYDDLNEYFWSRNCFDLDWPLNRKAAFFSNTEKSPLIDKQEGLAESGGRKSKSNFVEVRTFWHLFRSFDRIWIFLILAFQAMAIVAFSPSHSLTSLFEPHVFKTVLSIFITYAFLNLLHAVLDVVLSFKSWGSLEYTQIARYILKVIIAASWLVIIPIGYSSSQRNPTGVVRFFSDWADNWQNRSFYKFALALFMAPNMMAMLLFFAPSLRKKLEQSNFRVIAIFMWWSHPKLYAGRGMHEGITSLLKYMLFWVLLLSCKLVFSYYVEILPLVGPTKVIFGLEVGNYEWHEFFPNVKHNYGVIISLWAPIVMVYFMDTQIWFAIFQTIFGGILGAFSHLGEIRTLGMLRSRFNAVPAALSQRLLPYSAQELGGLGSTTDAQKCNAKFSQVWNEFISSMRKEDLISNREMELLLVPYSSRDISVVQWPPFLLASKIPIALDMAKDFRGKVDEELIKKVQIDEYMYLAVIECYQTLRHILSSIFSEHSNRIVIDKVDVAVRTSLKEHKFLEQFRMSQLPQLSNKLEKLLAFLKGDDIEKHELQINNVIQDIMDIITEDIMLNGDIITNVTLNERGLRVQGDYKQVISLLRKDQSWMEKVIRLHVLLTMKESAIDVPMNLEARRRITFFANSLFMNMPPAPQVHKMLSFSVLTPYYKEDVLYSADELNKENEDGVSILFYLQKIYPDEWNNFLERISASAQHNEEIVKEIRHWVSYRGQTLSRSVRGMMYYRQALELQCFLDMAKDDAILTGYRRSGSDRRSELDIHARAVADTKFMYVVSCQVYGQQKKSPELRDECCYQNILDLMLRYPSLRIAFIDEREETHNNKTEKVYYSVLVKGVGSYDEEIYRIKLPGPPTVIGEGKPENQNHAIIFTRGEALQTIDMNQDNYLEEAFKMRNVLEEFVKTRHGREPTILGLREHIFTGSVSSLAWFMSNQETSFVTIGQRVLANPLKVRFHYGHPDIFDRIFHISRGGISKASKTINLSEDIFSGYNSTLRGGNVTHHEYIQVGKGRDVGMNQITQFEAKVASGNGEQTLSREVYRLGKRFDVFRMLSFYFTTVGFYFSSLITVLTVYVFLYGRLYLVLSGLEREILDSPTIHQSKALEMALASQSIVQLGLLLVLPMVMETGLERGFRMAIGQFVIMQLELASVFFTFHLGTKAHYYARTLLHGGSKYRPTGRGFVVLHAKFAESYRIYSRSHFVKGLELLFLLLIYHTYGYPFRSSNVYLLITASMWFLVFSWLFAPFIFNPSGFEWQKTVNDWTNWKKWMGNRGGIGISPDRSWESWWEEEQTHLKHTNLRGRVLEMVLALRFLIYQYGIVYQLNIAHHSRSILVYALSWLVMVSALSVLKMVSVGRLKFGTDFQLMFRILKALIFIGFVSVMAVLFVVCGLTASDVLASILCFMPTGWAIILIAQACRPLAKVAGLWDSIQELARTYDYVMGVIIFMPIAALSWFPFVSEFQTRILFNQAFSRGLQISRIISGAKAGPSSR